MTWKNGRRLATFTKGDVSASFDYDADGLRTTKTVGTSRVDYYRAGGLLLGEVHTNGSESYTINYMYDESGRMLGFRLDGEEYYYVRDYSGDVTGLINSRGELIGSYLYDPWGVLLETYLNTFEEETSEWTDADRAEYMRVLNLNPIRYKSYYYDTETGFYYLQSRYYDPITTRFINADGLISTGTGVLGYNMFAYCNNNPIMFADPSGTNPCPMTEEHMRNCFVGKESCTIHHKAIDVYILRRKTPHLPVDKEYNIRNNDYPNYPGGGAHNGTDIHAPEGSTVYSVASGIVINVQKGYANNFKTTSSGTESYGNYIDIKDDNGIIYRYAHMHNNIPWDVGQEIGAGAIIGEVGYTGCTYGPNGLGYAHLHFEIRIGHPFGKTADPSNYLP